MLAYNNLGRFIIVALLFATIIIYSIPIQSAVAVGQTGGIRGVAGERLAVPMAVS
jgi:hypothetical protein